MWSKLQNIWRSIKDRCPFRLGMDEKSLRWNRFLREVCGCELDELSAVQRKAVLCFWYDNEVNHSGHLQYFDCYPDTDPQELAEALRTVGNSAMADNYLKAVAEGEKDGWQETDCAYYAFSPSLIDCLEEYVEKNKDVIFENAGR